MISFLKCFCAFTTLHTMSLYIFKGINFMFAFTFMSLFFFFTFCHWVKKNSPGSLILFKLITKCSFLSQCNVNQNKQQEHITLFFYFCAVSSWSLKFSSLFVKSVTLIKHYTTYDCTVSYESH